MRHLKTYETLNIKRTFKNQNKIDVQKGDYIFVKDQTGAINNIWENLVYVIDKFDVSSTLHIRFISKDGNIEEMKIFNHCAVRKMTEEEINKFELELTTNKYNI